MQLKTGTWHLLTVLLTAAGIFLAHRLTQIPAGKLALWVGCAVAVLFACAVGVEIYHRALSKYGPPGETPLDRVIREHDESAMRKILAASGETPEQAAQSMSRLLAEWIDQGDAEAVRLLLRFGADPDAAGDDGESAVMRAAHRGEMKIVEILLAAGAKIEAKANIDDIGENIRRLLRAQP
ncbi:MAG: ankyrin repeat domain-containing protein [Elusimicrobiota bacterium]